jgi:hypothetical protein
MEQKNLLENIRTTHSGDVVLLKRPKELNHKTFNVTLTFAEYEYLVENGINRFEVLIHGQKSRKVQWDPKFLQYAQFHGTYYLVPYSEKSLLMKFKKEAV